MSGEERKTLSFRGEQHMAGIRRTFRSVELERQKGNRESESTLTSVEMDEELIRKKYGIKREDSPEVARLKKLNYRSRETIVNLLQENAAFRNTVRHFAAWEKTDITEEEAQKILDHNYDTIKENSEHKKNLENWTEGHLEQNAPLPRPRIKKKPKQ